MSTDRNKDARDLTRALVELNSTLTKENKRLETTLRSIAKDLEEIKKKLGIEDQNKKSFDNYQSGVEGLFGFCQPCMDGVCKKSAPYRSRGPCNCCDLNHFPTEKENI